MKTYIELLWNYPAFSRLWLAQVISLMGDWFNTVVLSALVSLYSGGSGLAISAFLMARFLPPLLVSPLAGVLIDRYDRKRLLIWSNLLRAFVVPLFLLVDTPDKLIWIYIITIAQFTLSAIFEPGQSAIIPALVDTHLLVAANTLVSVTWSVMLAVGAVAGGVFAAQFGNSAALLADAATFAIAAALIATIDYRPPPKTASPREHTNFISGLRFVRQSSSVASALFVKIGTHIGNVDTLMTIFATQIFIIGNNGELSLGILYSVFGVGALLGPLVLNAINDGSVGRLRWLILLGFGATAVGWLILGQATSFALVAAGIFVRAVGGSCNWTYSTVLIQKTTPNAYLGRVFALDFAGFQLVTVVSTLVHGGLVDVFGRDHIGQIALWTGLVALLPLVIWAYLIRWLNMSPLPTASGAS